WVTGKSRELLNMPPRPHDRLGLKNLESADIFHTFLGYAGWVWRGIFSHSSHFAPIVDLLGHAVIPTERGKPSQNALLPNRRGTPKVCSETAKIFAQWIRCGIFSLDCDVATLVERISHTAV